MATTRKIAVVTGSSRGIGKAIAINLAAQGFALVINYVNSEKEANEVANSIRSRGGDAVAIRADVASIAGAASLIHDTIKHFGAIDVLIHNASIAKFGSFETATEADYDALAAVQKGSFFLFAETAKHIRSGGNITFISSIATRMIDARMSAVLYSALKSAVETYVRNLARELAPKKVTVNTVSPGFTETDMLPGNMRETAINNTPLKRLGTPEDIANVVGFLASDQGKWITGQNIIADGGIVQLQ